MIYARYVNNWDSGYHKKSLFSYALDHGLGMRMMETGRQGKKDA